MIHINKKNQQEVTALKMATNYDSSSSYQNIISVQINQSPINNAKDA
jgi:hypothetical protein